MKETLQKRLEIAMRGPPPVTQADLARACDIKPPSVSAWISGETKSIRGNNLLSASRALNVRPEWLSTGKLPMRPTVGMNLEPQVVSVTYRTLLAIAKNQGYRYDLLAEPAWFVQMYDLCSTLPAGLSALEQEEFSSKLARLYTDGFRYDGRGNAVPADGARKGKVAGKVPGKAET